MNNYYNIQPVMISVGPIEQASAVTIALYSSYTPFSTSMSYAYNLYSVDGAMLYNGSSVLGEAVLAGWGDSDEYIIEAMITNLGLVYIP